MAENALDTNWWTSTASNAIEVSVGSFRFGKRLIGAWYPRNFYAANINQRRRFTKSNVHIYNSSDRHFNCCHRRFQNWALQYEWER